MTSWLGIFYFESETSHDSQWNYYFGSCGVPLMAHSSGISEWMYHIWRSSTHSCERTLSFQFHVPWPLSLKPRQPFSIRGNRLLSVFFIFFSVVSIWQEWCVQQVCPIWLLTSELMARAFHCDGWGREVKRVYLTCVLKKKNRKINLELCCCRDIEERTQGGQCWFILLEPTLPEISPKQQTKLQDSLHKWLWRNWPRVFKNKVVVDLPLLTSWIAGLFIFLWKWLCRTGLTFYWKLYHKQIPSPGVSAL